MANLAGILKEEMARQARKELRGETETLKKASSRYRTDIAALKRKLATLEQQISRLERLLARNAPMVTQKTDTSAKPRFSASGLKKYRERLGLSASRLSSILGVSAQTIYNWESAGTRPNNEQIAKIAFLRKMSRREVQERLNQMRTA